MLVHLTLTYPTTWDSASIVNYGFMARKAFLHASHSLETSTFGPYLKEIELDMTESEAAASFYVHSEPELIQPR
jgi:hypothetical protein